VPDPCSFEPESEVAHLAEQMKTLLETAEPTDDCIQLPTSSTEESRQLEVSQALQTAGLKIGDRVVVGGVKVSVNNMHTAISDIKFIDRPSTVLLTIIMTFVYYYYYY